MYGWMKKKNFSNALDITYYGTELIRGIINNLGGESIKKYTLS